MTRALAPVREARRYAKCRVCDLAILPGDVAHYLENGRGRRPPIAEHLRCMGEERDEAGE